MGQYVLYAVCNASWCTKQIPRPKLKYSFIWVSALVRVGELHYLFTSQEATLAVCVHTFLRLGSSHPALTCEPLNKMNLFLSLSSAEISTSPPDPCTLQPLTPLERTLKFNCLAG